MKNIKVVIFIVLIILAVSCKKKKAMNPIILQDYELKFMLNLYPSNPSIIADTPVDDDTPSIIEVRINDEYGTVYTDDYFKLNNSITVKEATTVDIVIQAKEIDDKIYLGGYVVDNIEDYSPVSNGMYKYSFTVGGNTSFIIGVDGDSDHSLVNYNAYKLINRGRGMSDMYVITNFGGTTDTDYAFGKYRVARKSSATITLPKSFDYSLVLEAIPDSGYNLQYWTPYQGFDSDPVITGGVSGDRSLLVFVEPNLIVGNDYFIEDPLVLVAEFSLYPGWTGAEEVEEPTRSGISSYEVSLASHIAWIAQKVENGLDFKYYTFSLISDIDMNNVPFSGIASGTKRRFNATFNGNGYAITNLLLKFTDGSKAENAGFIGSLGKDGSVSNLTIAMNSVVESIGGNNLGTVVGYNDGGKVFYCTNYASIDANGIGYNVGGVVGYNYRGELFGLHNAGAVGNGGRSIGGVVGYSTAPISSSYNTGTVEGLYDVGGVVGLLGGVAVSRSYNAGAVTATMSNAGGVVGSIAVSGGQIVNCYNIGDVKGTTTGAGGILGYSYGGSITIDKALSLGIIEGTSAGGLVGGLSSSTTVGTGSGEGLLNMYFLKNTTVNNGLDNSGLEDIPASMSSLKTLRSTDAFSSGSDVHNCFSAFNTIDKGDWQYAGDNSALYNIPKVNDIAERFILNGLGEGQMVRN